ncbi:MAG: hypothetical protein U0166_23165 [Acidobacteriota bacterium]
MYTLWVYGFYLAFGVGFTIWVAQTLKRHGRIFLLDACHGREALADSINHLLTVGFYLVTLGYISTALRITSRPEVPVDAMEILSTKLGMVLLVLGAMHFFDMAILARTRRRGMLDGAPPPVSPDARIDAPLPA